MTNLERHRKDLTELLELGECMSLDLEMTDKAEVANLSEEDKTVFEKKVKGAFRKNYQRWYTEACSIIDQLVPERKDEFVALYLADSKRKEFGMLSYTIQDWLLGVRSGVNPFTRAKGFDDSHVVTMKFESQLNILKAVERRFESSLFEIKQLLRADLLDSELAAAEELLKHGFLRAAGAVSGVVIEKHLGAVCSAHSLSLKKQHPTISTYNDELKNSSVIDVPTWRFIQRLGDLRNLCDHGKGREPNKEEIEELIEGVKKISKTVY